MDPKKLTTGDGAHLVQLVPFLWEGHMSNWNWMPAMLPGRILHQDGADNLDMQNKVQL